MIAPFLFALAGLLLIAGSDSFGSRMIVRDSAHTVGTLLVLLSVIALIAQVMRG